MLATAVATIVSVTTVIFTTTVAQEDQHQYDDGNQYPVVVKAITKTHWIIHLRDSVIHLMPGGKKCYNRRKEPNPYRFKMWFLPLSSLHSLRIHKVFIRSRCLDRNKNPYFKLAKQPGERVFERKGSSEAPQYWRIASDKAFFAPKSRHLDDECSALFGYIYKASKEIAQTRAEF